MRKIKRMMLCVVGAVIFALSGAVFAGESLDVNGTFAGAKGWPNGWHPNAPAYWEEGALVLTKVPDTKKNALQLTSKSKEIHIYNSICQDTRFLVSKGDKIIFKSLVKGKGTGAIGVYAYPAGSVIKKDFKATEKWTEFATELSISGKVKSISVIIAVSVGSSVKFMDLTVEIEKKKTAIKQKK